MGALRPHVPHLDSNWLMWLLEKHTRKAASCARGAMRYATPHHNPPPHSHTAHATPSSECSTGEADSSDVEIQGSGHTDLHRNLRARGSAKRTCSSFGRTFLTAASMLPPRPCTWTHHPVSNLGEEATRLHHSSGRGQGARARQRFTPEPRGETIGKARSPLWIYWD